MDFLVELWLPILLSSVAVFIVSSIVHMCTPMHKSDYKHLSGEEDILKGLRDGKVGVGDYMFPGATSMKDMSNPEYIAKCDLGPVGYMTILPNGMWNMNKSLLQWFLFSVVTSVLTAYIADATLVHGEDFGRVFRVVGTISTMAYACGTVPNSIWKGVDWGVTFKFVIDGLLYGLSTGAVFAWLWPSLL